MKYSKQREQILNIVNNSFEHPTAYMVYEQVKKEIPNISLGTVYRNLNALAYKGVIRRFLSDDAKARYDANITPHQHMQCTCCKKVFDCPPMFYSILQEDILKRTGFHVLQQQIYLTGICAECSDNKNVWNLAKGFKIIKKKRRLSDESERK